MSSPSYPLVLSPLLNPKGASVVHELKVLAATAFNYVVAIVVVMLPSFAAIYSIIALFTGNWLFLLCLAAFLLWYIPRSYRVPRHLDGEGYVWEAMRQSSLYKYTAEYFPIRLARTTPLDNQRQYIFGMHPHGVIPTFVTVSMMTQGCHWDKLFPGIELRGLAASSNFWVPLWRDIYLWLGYIDASASVAYKALNKGHSLVVLPGGEQEMMLAKPGDHSVVLKNRMGFVRLAIQSGAWLVPTYAFGANDTYYQVEAVRSLNRWTSSKFRVVMPLFYGRWKTLMPLRKPISVVVGKPIPVEKNPSPSDKMVAHLHAKYVEELEKLFNNHKAQFGAPDASLDILEAQSHRKKQE